MTTIQIFTTNVTHAAYTSQICAEIENAAILRGTGIAKRDQGLIREKIEKGDAIIALDGDELAGFCYVQLWSEGRLASHSGLIVLPNYRKQGIAAKVKKAALDLVAEKYTDANVFGITTNLHVIKLNTELGYSPTTFSEITQDSEFWEQCRSCPNFDILERTNRKLCLCTAMVKKISSNDRVMAS